MDPQFWHERWNEDRIGFHQEKINSRLVKLWPKLGLNPGDRVFVPLCGKTQDMIWLADQKYDVLGVELSLIACKDFFREAKIPFELERVGRFEILRGQKIELWAGDFFDLKPSDLFGTTGVYDRASLIALPAPMRRKYANHLSTILSADTGVLLISMEYDRNKMQGPPFSVSEEEIHQLFKTDFNLKKISESSGPDIVGNLKQRGLDTLTEKVYLLTRL